MRVTHHVEGRLAWVGGGDEADVLDTNGGPPRELRDAPITAVLEALSFVLTLFAFLAIKTVALWMTDPYGDDTTDYDIDFDLQQVWIEALEAVQMMRRTEGLPIIPIGCGVPETPKNFKKERMALRRFPSATRSRQSTRTVALSRAPSTSSPPDGTPTLTVKSPLGRPLDNVWV